MLYRFKERIGVTGVKLFVSPHQGNEIFGIAEVYYVVRPAGYHVDGFDFIT